MRRTLVDVAVLAPACALAWLVFGWPDPGGAVALVHSGDPAHGQVIAGVGLLAWVAIGVMCAVVAIPIARSAQPWPRAIAALLVGVLLLSLGFAVHLHRGFHVCCGSTQAAEQALGHAP